MSLHHNVSMVSRTKHYQVVRRNYKYSYLDTTVILTSSNRILVADETFTGDDGLLPDVNWHAPGVGPTGVGGAGVILTEDGGYRQQYQETLLHVCINFKGEETNISRDELQQCVNVESWDATKETITYWRAVTVNTAPDTGHDSGRDHHILITVNVDTTMSG